MWISIQVLFTACWVFRKNSLHRFLPSHEYPVGVPTESKKFWPVEESYDRPIKLFQKRKNISQWKNVRLKGKQMKLLKKLYLLWFMRIANLVTGVICVLMSAYYLIAGLKSGSSSVFVIVLIFLTIAAFCFYAFIRLKKAVEEEKNK